MVRTWCFHYGGLGSIRGWGTEILQTARQGQTKRGGKSISGIIFISTVKENERI